MAWRGVIEEYRSFLPMNEKDRVVTLLEGNTPLVPAGRPFGERGPDVYFKLEGLNPTGSFKDRGMTLAVSKAASAGCRVVICASTGNTSAAAAAYAARAGLACWVLIPAGAVALGKLAQALVYGARVMAVEGNFDEALALVREVSAGHREVTVVNSINPFRLEGQKTGAFEICDQLGGCPDYLSIPVGNAGNISAYWQGFCEYYSVGRTRLRPAMLGFQAAGAAPLVEGRPVDRPETIATAIRIGRPANGEKALAAVRESGGRLAAVSDEEILDAYRELAGRFGVFAEPASAASWAGVRLLASQGFFRGGERVVCILTGNGLKDPDRAVASSPDVTRIRPRLAEVERVIGW